MNKSKINSSSPNACFQYRSRLNISLHYVYHCLIYCRAADMLGICTPHTPNPINPGNFHLPTEVSTQSPAPVTSPKLKS